MTKFYTDWSDKENFTDYINSVPSKLSELINDGLLELDPQTCKVTLKGRPFIRNICMAFDAHLARKTPGTNLFSKTI